MFLAPLILIKEHESLPMAYWDKSPLAYKDKIVGIHADASQIEELREVYHKLYARKRLYQFCCALNGSQGVVGKATAILKQDIDALPYPESDKDLELSFWEQAPVDNSVGIEYGSVLRAQLGPEV